jgi:MoaA/NifB/PqqE/SkfB family radical SAM enzyme
MKFLRLLKLLCRILVFSRRKDSSNLQMPYKLALSLTNECDCQCKNCSVWKTYEVNPSLKKEELSAGQIDKLFQKNGDHFFWVALTGGEPFLRNDLVEIVRSCVVHCPNLLLLSIVTTGVATEQILDKMTAILDLAPRLRIYVTVSIDGEEAVHERNRRVKGAYARSVRTIEALDKLSRSHGNLKVRIETVLSKQNLEHLDSFLSSHLIKSHETCFAFAQESDRYFNQGAGIALQGSDAETAAQAVRQVLEHPRGLSLEKLMLRTYYRLSARFFRHPHHQVIPCYSGFVSVFVGPYGEVRPCVMMPAVGNLKNFDFDLRDLMRSGPMLQSRRAIIEDRCPNCWTPCEAMQTMGQNFGLAWYRSLRGRTGAHASKVPALEGRAARGLGKGTSGSSGV